MLNPRLLEQLKKLPPGLQEVVDGYISGHFLMADEDAGTLNWFGAPEHTLMPLDERLHVPKSLNRPFNQNRFEVRISTDINGVLAGCQNRESTWISSDLANIYQRLARVGIVQTYETWQNGTLAGGVLGLHLGGAFIGESMFTAIEDGGKVALVSLCRHLAARGFLVFDAQLTNPHLERFGSYQMELEPYLALLKQAVGKDCLFT
jgi:leucyl/phenylalanyl-tRNA--protein transferase